MVHVVSVRQGSLVCNKGVRIEGVRIERVVEEHQANSRHSTDMYAASQE